MRFTFICEHCRFEIRHRATIEEERQLLKTLTMSFSCPNCRQPVHVQMCSDASIVSISAHQAAILNTQSGIHESSDTSFSEQSPAATKPSRPLPPVGGSSQYEPPRSTASPPPPARDAFPPVTGHVPFASLDEVAKKRQANTGFPFLDGLINDPPTPTQMVLGVLLIIFAIFLNKLELGNSKSESPAPPSKDVANNSSTRTLTNAEAFSRPAADSVKDDGLEVDETDVGEVRPDSEEPQVERDESRQ